MVEDRPRRKRRWVIWFGAVGCLVFVAWIAVLALDFGTTTWQTDGAEMAKTQDRLATVADELTQLRSPGDGTEWRPKRSGCSVDSGDLMQPRLNQWWEVPKARVAERMDDLVASMSADGWVGATPRDLEAEMQRSFGPWTAHAWVYADDGELGDTKPYVAVEVTIVDAAPCRAD